MPTIPHIEKHFMATETVRDVVIGMADGLTVPFALAAGLSAAVSNTSVIVTAGLAEIAAGAIAMGLGGYLAARTTPSILRRSRPARNGDRQQAGIRDQRSSSGLCEIRANWRRTGQRSGFYYVGSETLDGFHDAVRTRIGKARSQTCTDQCGDHRHFIPGWWPHSAPALHADKQSYRRLENFGPYYGCCAARFRGREGTLYGRQSFRVRRTNSAGGRIGGRRRVLARSSVCLVLD